MAKLTCTIFVISWMSITPLPSTSYIRNAHLSFSSGVPLDVTSIASKNSWNDRRVAKEQLIYDRRYGMVYIRYGTIFASGLPFYFLHSFIWSDSYDVWFYCSLRNWNRNSSYFLALAPPTRLTYHFVFRHLCPPNENKINTKANSYRRKKNYKCLQPFSGWSLLIAWLNAKSQFKYEWGCVHQECKWKREMAVWIDSRQKANDVEYVRLRSHPVWIECWGGALFEYDGWWFETSYPYVLANLE